MLSFMACLASVAALPFMFVFVRASTANIRAERLRQLVTAWSVANAAAALTALIISLQAGATTIRLGLFSESSPFQINLLFDSVSTVMWTLVAGVGWVICRYSVRYLDGDQHQGRYFKWVSFTLSAVAVSVLSANLFLTVVGYLLTSIGLHCLLLHRNDRVAARFPANLKFLFSRLGDLCLVGAAMLLYREFGTANLPELFEAFIGAFRISNRVIDGVALSQLCCWPGVRSSSRHNFRFIRGYRKQWRRRLPCRLSCTRE